MARTTRRSQDVSAAQGTDIWRIAKYIRLSKEDGNDESESVANQRHIINEYIDSSFAGAYEVVDEYVDDGLTGTDDSREDFARMIQDIEEGKVNCIICKTLARAFRNYSDQGYYLEDYFEKKKVRFVSIGSPHFDTFKDPDSITGFEVPISGIMNDRFAARTSQDVRRTFNSKRKRGEFIGAFAPYGYKKAEDNKNQLVLDEEIVPIKREILRWIIQDGMTWSSAARKLNDLGILNPTAYKRSKGMNYRNPHALHNDGLWEGSTLKRIMLDPVNIGHMIQGRQQVVSYKVHDRENMPQSQWFKVENTHAPTFTQQEYETLLRTGNMEQKTPSGESTVHLLSGFIRCMDCKKAMHRKAYGKYVYYFCRTYTMRSTNHCTKHSITEEKLKELILDSLRKYIEAFVSLEHAIKRKKESPTRNTKSERIGKMLEDRQKDLANVRFVSDSLYTDWKMGIILRDDYIRMKARHDEQVEELSRAIANLEKIQTSLESMVDSNGELFDAFKKNKSIQSLDRSILCEFIDEVLVCENKQLIIKFRHADKVELLLDYLKQNGIKT